MSETGNLDKALVWLDKAEGGYADVKGDRGGKTFRGITAKAWNQYRTGRGLPLTDVRTITDAQWREFYRDCYWAALHCGQFEHRVAVALFDTAVLHGVGYAIRRLQALQNVKVTGTWTQELAAALKDVISWDELLYDFLQVRDDRYEEIVARDPIQRKFYNGWEKRLDQLTAYLGLEKTE